MAWNTINGLQVLYCFLRVSKLQYQLATVNLAFLVFLSVWMAYAVSVYIRNVSRAALPSNFMLSGVKKPCSYGNNDAQTGWYRCQGIMCFKQCNLLLFLSYVNVLQRQNFLSIHQFRDCYLYYRTCVTRSSTMKRDTFLSFVSEKCQIVFEVLASKVTQYPSAIVFPL